ncbi:hypothetical protein [Rhizobium leguminosarum]|uniref:hypothetical protein n=1 Tax=Rhizobium leguminosarum TaxID=384 RepID=UPI0021B0DB6F|nr:hypothetical protein [Rhizobium leguminosarum]
MVRDFVVRAEVVRYRRECWVTPEGRTIIAPLPAGIKGGYGASLRRFCLMLHSHGQVTTQRLTTLLNDVGVEITASSLAMIATKRQVIRFLTQRLDGFHAEDAAVLQFLYDADWGQAFLGLPHRAFEVAAELCEPAARQLSRLCSQ